MTSYPVSPQLISWGSANFFNDQKIYAPD